MKIPLWFFVCLLLTGSVYGQDEMIGAPVKVALGIGAGPSTPTGSLGDRDDAGWNAAAKVRLEGLIPLQIVGMVQYNRLPNRSQSVAPAVVGPIAPASSGEYDVAWLYGAGLEFPISLPVIRPYIGVDGFVSSLSSTAANASSITREGVDAGIGAQIPFAVFGNVNVEFKYQIFNVAGKEQNEDTYSQVMANISLSFGIL